MFDFDVVTGPTPPLGKLPDREVPNPAAAVQEVPRQPAAEERRIPPQPLRQ